MTRVIVTGSRDWPDSESVRAELELVDQAQGPPHTLLHGGRGNADVAAHLWVRDRARSGVWSCEVFPAMWTKHHRAAGPIRNKRMVESGADLCLAFLLPCRRSGCTRPQPHYTHGASNCADLAEAAGIETRRFVR